MNGEFAIALEWATSKEAPQAQQAPRSLCGARCLATMPPGGCTALHASHPDYAYREATLNPASESARPAFVSAARQSLRARS
jgi:hypothetical protein